MNINGTSAIILIFLMTTLPVFMDRKCQLLADATSPSAKINLYSTLQDQLNATSNFTESEYANKTTGAMNDIYELAGKILAEQLKQEQRKTKVDSLNNGYFTGILVDEENPSHGHDVVPPTVAFEVANTDSDGAKNNNELINAQVVGSNVKQQLNRRRARKLHKAHRGRLCPRPYRQKKSYYTDTSEEGEGQSSRSKWADRRMQPQRLSSLSIPMDGGGNWKPSSISTESRQFERTAAVAVATTDTDGDRRWRRKSSSKESNAAGSEMNGLAERIGSGDDGSNQHGLPGDKWRKKLQIDGRRKNLRNCGSRPNLSEELIESQEEVAQDESPRRRFGYGDRINTRSADTFPEVFSRPLVDTNSLPVSAVSTGLNEAIRNANSLLTNVPNMGSNTPAQINDDPGHRIGKQIQSFDLTRLEGANAAPALPHVPGGENTNAANLTNVMERVLGELESLKECKGVDSKQPEGSPCDVIGTWNSETIGLQFHLSLADPSPPARAFVEGKKIEVEVTEKVPPRPHVLMDCDWYFTGSTLKQVGGPFYITAQKTERYIMATFAGLCKSCGGVPTIFGSWTFIYPAKDCSDISLAVENKRDVLRKDTLEAKRKHRKEAVHGKCSICH